MKTKPFDESDSEPTITNSTDSEESEESGSAEPTGRSDELSSSQDRKNNEYINANPTFLAMCKSWVKAKKLPPTLLTKFETGMKSYLDSNLEKLTIESKGPSEVLKNLGKFTIPELEEIVYEGPKVKDEYNTPEAKLRLGYYHENFETSLHTSEASQFIVGLLLGMDKQMLLARYETYGKKNESPIIKELLTSGSNKTVKELMQIIVPLLDKDFNNSLLLYAIDMLPDTTFASGGLTLKLSPQTMELYRILKSLPV